MNNNQVIERLKYTSKEQNLAIIKLSFLDILYRKKVIDKYDNDLSEIFNTLGSQYEHIRKSKEKVIENIQKINLIYEENLKDDNKLEYFKNIRKNIHRIIIDLSRYLTEILYYNTIYYDILSRKEFKGNIKIDLEKFYKEVYSFLIEDEELLNQKISEIIWTVPIKISKKKYYDILETSLKNSFKNYSKEKVDILFKRFKGIFNGTLEWGYVDSFDKYFRASQYYKDVDYKNISYEELDAAYMESKNTINEIEKLLKYIREMGIVINKFIIINLLKYDMNSLEIKDIDLYINKIENDSEEKLLIRINEMQEILITTTKDYQDITRNIIKNNFDIDKDIEYLYQKTEKVIGYLKDYFIEREELIFNKNEYVDQSYLYNSIENFIQFIDRNIKNMDNRNRKIRMKKILSLIDNPFRTPDEFFYYLKSSLEFNNDKEEMKYIMSEIYSIISDYKKRP
ncbi:hypothetical protein GOQ29_00995 [Clostridium sp. D2Q-14]|uniref:hypothetical protein n=1 Tax=Anaeromonas gelatinilytica TaxID=2683194 RepID=UPI00193B276A|nr:hypothetical protein [Anaeromonas gelatinilytica]MBS4534188.1 hypothetical protein [Anaeromonas gelatinilytica]